ncbi:MAG: UDP-N-acetylmuramate:L-alanyl-gamma-D-glutamyl-meso-diaminopimelate ligase [Acidobacteria bacterium]|nr:UDP-N-acetylmuramate:L-alanyl-gamma-D-glutamyl-meso-diaminopimelate ligase [Acidobacteriota bacterium]
MTARPLDIYCIAIGGTGMAPLACLLQELGHEVRGSDGPLYPPMSTLLEAAGIVPEVGFDAGHLDPAAGASTPDLVIVGNAVPRGNPEAQQAEALGVERISMPQAVARFLLAGRKPVVVAGTHGKTTTTAMTAWVLEACGANPGYLIGGMPKNLPASFALGSGERFVIEGDEYNASYFDREAKFLHYRPHTAILTSVEYDHADLYPTPEDLLAAYRKLLALVPKDGLLVAWGDSKQVRQLCSKVRCPVVFYGFGEDNDVRPMGGSAGVHEDAHGASFRIRDPEADAVEIHLQVSGRHNVLNALAAWAVARRDGLEASRVAAALSAFQGTARRLEELGTVAGVTVVDDFAHHPTAVRASLEALRRRFAGRRLTALFEPRSLTAGREMFYDAYRESFRCADRVLFAPIFHAGRLEPEERLDLEALVDDLDGDGVSAEACASIDEVLSRALALARPGDVLVTMSSGGFDGLPRRLLANLEQA